MASSESEKNVGFIFLSKKISSKNLKKTDVNIKSNLFLVLTRDLFVFILKKIKSRYLAVINIIF